MHLTQWMRLNRTILTNRARQNWKKYISPVLLVLGMMLLGYVASEYYGMHREQQRLRAEWDRQQVQWTATAQNPTAPQPVDDGLIRLDIPKIDLSAIVVDGTTRKQLKNGPGRILSTPLPGEKGNSVISAHRDTFFRHIYELKAGDEIDVQRNGQSLKFEVTGKKIVDPDDLSVLKQSEEPQLTLITCYPTYYIGPAPQRLVVFSKLVHGDKTVAADERR
jgi:sortase A